MVWQGGQLAAVLDWEAATTRDPLADLAIARLDMLWVFGKAAMHAFTGLPGAVAPRLAQPGRLGFVRRAPRDVEFGALGASLCPRTDEPPRHHRADDASGAPSVRRASAGERGARPIASLTGSTASEPSLSTV